MSRESRAVFLSYASQDADAARKLCDALRAAQVEVWFDQSELVGGDAWDQKIRKQIKECALFVPVISANTQARAEGYFRLEWRMADQRTHLMGRSKPFLLPVCIDETRDADADVPDSFLAVQWMRVPGDAQPKEFCERVRRLLAGERAVERLPEPSGVEIPSASKTKSLPAWRVPAAIGGVLVLAVIGVLFSRRHPAPPVGTASSTVVREAEVSPVARARALFYHYDATRNDFTLAESLLKRAGELEPGSAEILGASAVLNIYFNNRGYDIDPRRLTRASALTDQALRLHPQQPDALFALGLVSASNAKDYAKAHDYLVLARRGMPENTKVISAIAMNYVDQLKFQEGLRELVDAAPRFPGDPELPYYAGLITKEWRRNEESVQWLERSLAIAPMWRALTMRAQVELALTGDGAKALQWLDRVPDSRRDDLRVVFWRVEALRAQRRGTDAREVLTHLPESFFQDNTYYGPKALLLAQACELEGRADLAAEAWQTAERLLRERIGAQQDRDSELRGHLFLVLAALGRGPEAREVADIFERDFARPRRPIWDDQKIRSRMARGYARLGDAKSAVRWLRESFAQAGGFGSLTRVVLRTSPDWDSIRDTPEFQTLLAEPDEPKSEAIGKKPGGVVVAPDLSTKALATVDQKSVAVLAFANIPDDKSNEYFSDGISEELLNVLAKIPGLKVTARTSAFHFKGKDTPIPEIAKQLGVAYVVEGSVRKIGTQLRIAARLLNGADGAQVWADDFREELKDVFALQDKIAGHIAKNLAVTLGTGAPGPLAIAPPTKNLAAYDAYLRGRALQTGGHTRPTVRETVEFYEDAVRLDPAYALAWARLTQAFLWLHGTAVERSEPHAANARKAAETAVRIGADLPEAHLAMAAVRERIDRDYAAAQRHVDRAERLRPNNPEVLAAHARLEFARGNWGAGLVTLVMRSVELDPQNVEPLDFGSRILMEVGRFAETEELLIRWSGLAPTLVRPLLRRSENHLAWTGDAKGALEKIPDVTEELPRNFLAWSTRASIYEAMGNLDAAVADYERRAEGGRRALRDIYRLGRLESRRGNESRAAALYAEALTLARQRESENLEDGPAATVALAHAALRQRSEALTAMTTALQRATETQDASRLSQTRRAKAEMLGMLGDVRGGVAELQAVHDQGYGFGYTLRVHPRWDPLRADAKFQQLMREAEARADAQPWPKK